MATSSTQHPCDDEPALIDDDWAALLTSVDLFDNHELSTPYPPLELNDYLLSNGTEALVGVDSGQDVLPPYYVDATDSTNHQQGDLNAPFFDFDLGLLRNSQHRLDVRSACYVHGDSSLGRDRMCY